MKEVTITGILDVINGSTKLRISDGQLDEKLAELGMDSIAFIQIVVGLEAELHCEFPDSKLLITEMDTVRKIYQVLQELYEAQSA